MKFVEDYWNAWQKGDWSRVHDGISAEITRNPLYPPHYCNRGLCRLQMRRLDEALFDFQTAQRLRQDNSGYAKEIGVALWWLRRTDEAIAAWRGGLDAKYTDAAGGVELPSLLLFASIRTADPALEKDARGRLRKRWRTKQARSAWPGPVAGFLLGNIGEEEFLSVRPWANAVMDARRACQAHFWAGVQRLRASDQNGFLAGLLEAVSDDDPEHSIAIRLESEYWLAQAEIELTAMNGR
jgi:tetratricopeptide (TPR) repeat protein